MSNKKDELQLLETLDKITDQIDVQVVGKLWPLIALLEYRTDQYKQINKVDAHKIALWNFCGRWPRSLDVPLPHDCLTLITNSFFDEYESQLMHSSIGVRHLYLQKDGPWTCSYVWYIDETGKDKVLCQNADSFFNTDVLVAERKREILRDTLANYETKALDDKLNHLRSKLDQKLGWAK